MTHKMLLNFAVSVLLSAIGQAQITGVTAGTDLTGGGTSGNVTLNLNTAKVPQLASANTFTANQSITGSLSASGPVSASSFEIGGNLFGFGAYNKENAFLGYAGNSSITGSANSALGYTALLRNTSGSYNTAMGYQALFYNTSGGLNTAIGESALIDNTTGSDNTAIGQDAGCCITSGSSNTFLGYDAVAGSATIQNATAIGANSGVSESNALILGGISNNAVSVGIGTATPYTDYALDVETVNSNGVINGGIVVNGSGGNLYLGMTDTVHKFRVDTNGAVYADGGLNSSGADFAESVAVRGARSAYEQGDVLEIDPKADRRIALSHRPYETLVAGIYSTKPGLLATPRGIDDLSAKTTEIPMAVVGIVPCKVTTENGTIARGDLLVTSSRPGYAMKGTDRRRLVGAVLGKALEPLEKGTGTIQVLVTLQ